MKKFVSVLMCAMLLGSSIAMLGMGEIPVGDTPKATWNVPGDFLTIQLAINGAGIGDKDGVIDDATLRIV